MLTTTQQQLLERLVRAAKSLPDGERDEFSSHATSTSRTLTVAHNGLPSHFIEVYPSDLHALRRDGLIDVLSDIGGRMQFDISATGYATVDAPTKQWGPWAAVGKHPIGRGGLGDVWKVERAGDSESYALKTLRHAPSKTSTAQKRFEQEIDVLAKKLPGNPGIISIVDFSVPSVGGPAGTPYFVMPLAESTLAKAKRRLRGKAEPILEYGIQIADAIRAAHEQGVIHRDIKPENILLMGDDEHAVVADFGICFFQEDERLTRQDGNTLGTDDFVAPELKGGGLAAVTQAADVYSLGKTLYAVAADGRPLPREEFDHPNFDLAATYEDPRLLHLRGVVERMVVADPGARAGSMDECIALMKRALENVRRGSAYESGMYSADPLPIERARRVQKVLDGPTSVTRDDAITAAIAQATEAAEKIVSEYVKRVTGRFCYQVGKLHPESAERTAAAAEELVSVGAPLVMHNEKEAFEDWLGARQKQVQRRTDQESVREWMLAGAGATAVIAVAVLAWRRRRWSLLRMILENIARKRDAFAYPALLGNPYPYIDFLAEFVANSKVLGALESRIGENPKADVGIVWGLDAIAALWRMAPEEQDKQVRTALSDYRYGFPIEMTPALTYSSWMTTFFEAITASPKLERDLAKIVFDLDVPTFKQHVGRALPAAFSLLRELAGRSSRGAPFAIPINDHEWDAWLAS